MKDTKDIEELLKGARLPDRSSPKDRRDMWEQVLRRHKIKKSLWLRIRPWIWALASILLILICILFMIMLYHPK